MTRIFVTLGVWLLLDLYAFHGLRTLTSRWSITTAQIIHWAYWGVDLLILTIILYYSFSGKFSNGPGRQVGWVLGALMISLVPKLLVVGILAVEDIYRGIRALVTLSQKIMGFKTSETYLPERRKVVSQLAFGLATIPFFGMLYGTLKGKYDYRIHRVRLKFKDLPNAFNGFTITQLSDIHCGSFDDPDAVMRGIRLANKQNSDLLVFTGDFVNTKADELEEWFDHFKVLDAPMGKYSILGNHDYGDYIPWPTQEAKEANLNKLKQLQGELGFKLLLNEHVRLEKDGDSIVLAGVENWGKRGFVKHGDLPKAIDGVHRDDFTILLSHDPSHWEAITLNEKKHIHLTLSGHTHGMQFGVEIPGFKWSPSKYLYPQWAGLYSKNERHLYVNRGFGFLGFPGRVGILPEITVIELQKA
jgi:predicted MPP superfamily phosphohydrolase